MIFGSHFSSPRKGGEYWLDAISLLLDLLCASSSMSIGKTLAMWCFSISVFTQTLYYCLDEMVRVKVWKIGPDGMNAIQQGTASNPAFKRVPFQNLPNNSRFFNLPTDKKNLLVATGSFKSLLIWRTAIGFISTALIAIGFISAVF